MRQKEIIRFSLLLIFAILVFGFIGYFTYKNGYVRLDKSPIITTPTPQFYSTLVTPCGAEKTDGLIKITCDKYPLEFEIPDTWEYLSNVSDAQTIRGLRTNVYPNINDVFTNREGCVIYLGPGGGHGPSSDDLTNELVEIGGEPFTKRVWYKDKIPLFIAYLQKGNKIGNFENLWVSLPNNPEECINTINQILSTFEFLE